jgi:hypothetical protein
MSGDESTLLRLSDCVISFHAATPDDVSGSSYRNVVHIKYTPDSVQPPIKYSCVLYQPLSQNIRELLGYNFLTFLAFLVSWGGVRLSPLRTSDTNWPIVPAPDDR